MTVSRVMMATKAMSVFDDHVGFNSHDGLTRFFAPKQAGKGSILQETFLVVLGMHFLTLSSADIRFAEVLVWKTYTTKRLEPCHPKDLATAALEAYDEAL